MTKKTKDFLNRYNVTEAERKVLETIGLEGVIAKFTAMDEHTWEKLGDYFTGWLLGDNPKARFNYWARKAGVTEAEMDIYMTY